MPRSRSIGVTEYLMSSLFPARFPGLLQQFGRGLVGFGTLLMAVLAVTSNIYILAHITIAWDLVLRKISESLSGIIL